MDNPSSSRPRGINLLNFTLTAQDLYSLKDHATRHYYDHATPDMARSIIDALDRVLRAKGYTAIVGADQGVNR
jgi:hypothetical protein